MADCVLNHARKCGSRTPSSIGLSPAVPPAFSKCSDIYDLKYLRRVTYIHVGKNKGYKSMTHFICCYSYIRVITPGHTSSVATAT